MKTLVIDNYDSFTYNLVQIVGTLTDNPIVKRNDEISAPDIERMMPDKILISPGPGRPENSKISLESIKVFSKKIPILGVCLGHQAVGLAFGAKIVNAPILMHGKTSKIKHNGKGIYRDVKQNFTATRYHSLIIEKESLPDCLTITAETEDGLIMGIKHKELPVEGIQFHPESFMTEFGELLIKNWIEQ